MTGWKQISSNGIYNLYQDESKRLAKLEMTYAHSGTLIGDYGKWWEVPLAPKQATISVQRNYGLNLMLGVHSDGIYYGTINGDQYTIGGIYGTVIYEY